MVNDSDFQTKVDLEIKRRNYRTSRWLMFYGGVSLLLIGLLMLAGGSFLLSLGRDTGSLLFDGVVATFFGLIFVTLRFTKFRQPEMPQTNNAWAGTEINDG